jgi:helicase MOV-10
MQQLDVRFQLNRVTLRRQHQALYADHRAPHLLFPASTHVALSSRTLSKVSINLYDPKITNNPRQFRAIKQILSLPATSGPFIIFGP